MDALYRLQKGENVIAHHVTLSIFVSHHEFHILARTQREVAEAGRLLESLDISSTESTNVQERAIKAAAMSGLLTLATQLLDGLLEREVFPSSIAYVAVCNSLRQAGRVRRLEQVLYKLGSVATADESVSVVALNTYLAALCDGSQDASHLEHARDWLRPGVSSQRLGGTEPDEASYATVLHAAASTNNCQMVDKLWEEMIVTRNLQPTIYAYNSLLRSARGGPDGNAKILDLLDRFWKAVQPDRFTIDLVLVPLIRAQRIGDVEALLGDFVESRSVDVRTASNAFAAFLNTLVKAGELSTARAIFDTYLLPSLFSVDQNASIRPTARHFNLLIDGYRRLAESNRDTVGEKELQEETLIGLQTQDCEADRIRNARSNGCALFQTMLDAGISPDAYTLTSMLGLSSTTAEVTNVFRQAVLEYGVKVTPAVLRATMIAYGNVGDAPSACIVFDEFSAGTTNIRTWNALISALAKGAVDFSSPIIIDSSTEATALTQSPGTYVLDRGICKLVNGHACYEAIQHVLRLMSGGGDPLVNITRAPRPNSQTYCITASALQNGPANSESAMELFRDATSTTLAADGRFINAIFRCFGDDINGALAAWKNEIRRSCLAHELRRRPTPPPSTRRAKGKNLIASYHGLFHVCGRALRPDIAVRLVYAMNKEGIESNEVALNCYRSGKRTRQKLAKLNNEAEKNVGLGLAMSKQFESVLLVECTKFDENDKRRAGEKRVRIIL
jgi:hypothetical protein